MLMIIWKLFYWLCMFDCTNLFYSGEKLFKMLPTDKSLLWTNKIVKFKFLQTIMRALKAKSHKNSLLCNTYFKEWNKIHCKEKYSSLHHEGINTSPLLNNLAVLITPDLLMVKLPSLKSKSKFDIIGSHEVVDFSINFYLFANICDKAKLAQ